MRRVRLRLLLPLRRRDFALLTAGSAVSLLGDGFFSVTLAWQVYQISNVPTALAVVSAAQMLPSVLFVLIGGVIGDHFDRRVVMIGADALRAGVLGLAGLLAAAGDLRLWQLFLLMPLFGVADACFTPAAVAIVPELVGEGELPQANALGGIARPLMLGLLGPALGGLVVGAMGPAVGLLLDAASFCLSAAATLAIASRPRPRPASGGAGGALAQIEEGLAFVRSAPWCWAALAGTTCGYLFWVGPKGVLLPYLVKNDLHAGAAGLGLLFTVGGLGAIVSALALGQIGLPRRPITAVFLCGTLGVVALAGYGLMATLWQGMAVAFASSAVFAVNEVTWTTLFQRLVPRHLLGRVASVDLLLSLALVPISLALTGPAAALLGVRPTMTFAPLLGAAAFLAFYFVPHARDPERGPVPESGGVG